MGRLPTAGHVTRSMREELDDQRRNSGRLERMLTMEREMRKSESVAKRRGSFEVPVINTDDRPDDDDWGEPPSAAPVVVVSGEEETKGPEPSPRARERALRARVAAGKEEMQLGTGRLAKVLYAPPPKCGPTEAARVPLHFCL